MFHIELKCFPNSVWRFNMSEQQLYTTILVPWAKGESIELGEYTWRPQDTTITVLEGPEIPVGRLTMQRGWPTAQREGEDVTAETIATFQRRFAEQTGRTPFALNRSQSSSAGDLPPGAQFAGANDAVLADAFALELLRTLGEGALALHSVWRLAGERHSQLDGGGSLELATNAVVSLISSQLASLSEQGESEPLSGSPEELEAKVRSMDAWLADSGPGALQLRRS